MLVKLGVKRENVWMFDMYGLVYEGRAEDIFQKKISLPSQQNFHILEGKKTLHADALKGADVFIGLSVGESFQEKCSKR